MPTRAHVLETHIRAGVGALEALLASPDRNIDSLKPVTIDAIEHARAVLQTVQAVQRPVHV